MNCRGFFGVRIQSMYMMSKEMSKSITNNRNMAITLADTAHTVVTL
jgi:hypothetical protein